MKQDLSLKTQNNRITCSVVGARGYSGLELVKILLKHPCLELKYAFATSHFEIFNYLGSENSLNVECLLDSEIMKHLTDVVFLATPAEVSLKLVPQILAAGKKVIDLSGAFRLKKNDYKKWYGFQHTENQALEMANYGLLPWVGPAQSPQLISNPGCYATAISLALIPLIKNNLIHLDQIVIDAKSGATGAGRKATENLLFTEVDGECLPYKVGRHQHEPEILETIEKYTGVKIHPHMTTSLLPIRRGIIAGIYATLNQGMSANEVEAAYAEAYKKYPFIKWSAIKQNSQLLSLKKVVGTPNTHISYEVVDQKLYVFSCLDNLMKGAASQAVENINRMFDWPVETGLTTWEAII